MTRYKLTTIVALVMALSHGCATTQPVKEPEQKTPVEEAKCGKGQWCYVQQTKDALSKYGQALLAMEPKDAADYCPGFQKVDRTAFYAELIKWIAYRESGWDVSQEYREAFKNGAGETVVSTGITQVSYESCRSYGLKGVTTEELKKPENAIACTVMIGNRWSKDGYIGRSLGRQSDTDNGHRGFARYFSTMRPGSSKDYIKAKMKEFCK